MPHPLVRLVEIQETPLDVAAVLASVEGDGSGGVTLFVGRVRDHDRSGDTEKDVVGLDYSAHPTALETMRAICERVADAHPVHGIAAVHRVGSLAIGDIAVVVAAAAAHRGQAFDASRDLIDTLKSEVPIWKHQRFTDGTDEWVGSP
ncbi:MAG TPA: molybdenum cofactor biosynthesis protein MoaE [Nocardioides sp.]|nr:molybdenum cofactor biosynthesis protein MoaE [Nocardioides sp.]